MSHINTNRHVDTITHVNVHTNRHLMTRLHVNTYTQPSHDLFLLSAYSWSILMNYTLLVHTHLSPLYFWAIFLLRLLIALSPAPPLINLHSALNKRIIVVVSSRLPCHAWSRWLMEHKSSDFAAGFLALFCHFPAVHVFKEEDRII